MTPVDQRHHDRGCECICGEIFRDAIEPYYRRQGTGISGGVEKEFPGHQGDPPERSRFEPRRPEEGEIETGFRIPDTGKVGEIAIRLRTPQRGVPTKERRFTNRRRSVFDGLETAAY